MKRSADGFPKFCIWKTGEKQLVYFILFMNCMYEPDKREVSERQVLLMLNLKSYARVPQL